MTARAPFQADEDVDAVDAVDVASQLFGQPSRQRRRRRRGDARPAAAAPAPAGAVRTFGTGATRDVDLGKFDYEGFLSPLVLERFAQYMHRHRHQADGRLRDADNWQKGIPRDAYFKSALRHVMDVWFHHRGLGHLAREPLEESLCAVLFNFNGYLFETLRARSGYAVMRGRMATPTV